MQRLSERVGEREKLDLASKQTVRSSLIYNAKEKAPVLQLQQNILISSVHTHTCECAACTHSCMRFLPTRKSCEYFPKNKLLQACVCVSHVYTGRMGKINKLSSSLFLLARRYTMTEGLWRQYRESDVMQLQTLGGIRRNITHTVTKNTNPLPNSCSARLITERNEL